MFDRLTNDDFFDLWQPVRELSPRQELLAILLILAETMIIYIFAGTLLVEIAPPHAPLPVLTIFSILLIARLIPHLLVTIRVWTPYYEIIMATSVIATMLLTIKAGAFPEHAIVSLIWLEGARDALILQDSEAVRSVWMLIAFVSFAWWRGKYRAEANLETAYSMLRLGMIWLAGALVFTALAAPAGYLIYDHIYATLVGFVIFTLLAIAIARQPEGENAAAWNASWVWLLIFALPIFVIAATSVSTVGVLTRDSLDTVLSVLAPIFWLLQVTVQAMVFTIAICAFLLISPVIWLLERHGLRPMENFPTIDLSPGSIADAEASARTTLQIENPIRYLIVGLILLGLIWFLIRFTFRRRRQVTDSGRQQTESLIEWHSGGESRFRRLRNWIANQVRPVRPSFGPEGPEWAATRQIRQVYQHFLQVQKRASFPREPGETPSQFAQRLSAMTDAHSSEIEQMTRQYNRARYSGTPATSEEAEVMERAWSTYQEADQVPRREPDTSNA